MYFQSIKQLKTKVLIIIRYYKLFV